MSNPNNYQYELPNSYARRAKVAAWMTGFGLFAAGALEISQAEPASAAPEIAQSAEQNSEDFIASKDQRLSDLVEEVKSSKNVMVLHGSNPLLGNAPANLEVYRLTAPGSKPGLYNILSIAVMKGQNRPLEADTSFDAPYRLNTSGKGSSKGGFLFSQSGGKNHAQFTPNYMEIWKLSASDVSQYCVSANSADKIHPSFGKSTKDGTSFAPVQPSMVSRQFDSFFSSAEKIIKANSH